MKLYGTEDNFCLRLNFRSKTCYMEVSSPLMLVYECALCLVLFDVDDFWQPAGVLLVTGDSCKWFHVAIVP